MVTGEGGRTSSPWEEFGLRYAFGNKHGGKNYTESKKSRRRRLKTINKTPRSKKKKKSSIKELYQSHLTADGGYIYDDAEVFADIMKKKPPHTMRCGLQNLHLLSEHAKTSKSRQLVQHIRDGEYDVFLMNDIGLYWDMLGYAGCRGPAVVRVHSRTSGQYCHLHPQYDRTIALRETTIWWHGCCCYWRSEKSNHRSRKGPS